MDNHFINLTATLNKSEKINSFWVAALLWFVIIGMIMACSILMARNWDDDEYSIDRDGITLEEMQQIVAEECF